MLNNAAVVIGGDFNYPGWDWSNKIIKPGTSHPKLHYEFANILDDTGLTQLVERPTRGENTLDLFITNLPNQASRIEVVPGISDHDIVYVEFNLALQKLKITPRNIPIYKKANWDSMKKELAELHAALSQNYERDDVNTLWNKFKLKLSELTRDHIPHKRIKQKSTQPWISLSIQKLIKKRDRLYKKAKKCGDPTLKQKVKALKHTIQRQLRQAYWQYMEGVLSPERDGSQLQHSNTKKFWSYIKSKRTDYVGIPSLKQNGKLLHDPVAKAEALNDQFQSVFSTSDKITPEQFQDKCNIPSEPQYPVMTPFNITNEGVEKLLKGLKPGKAAGPDGIKTKILLELSKEISPILTLIFKKSLLTGKVPEDWKNAHVSPIYKKGDKTNPENYRPISLTCICCKLLEHIVCSNIMKHADNHNILYPLQHGFRKSRSCVSQLIEFIDDVSSALDAGRQSDVLVMDFSKAFDKVNHSLLLHKLRYYGISEPVIAWLEDLLDNRKQSVLVEGEMSGPLDVRSGVPQGSVIGPCLFLFYINDIPIGLESTVRLFADDTIVYMTVDSNADCTRLQNDLDKLAIWEDRWHMAFHPAKCNVLSITNNKNVIHYPYTLHGRQLERVTKAKYLGVTVQTNLKWDSHISNICNKANSTLGFLKRNLKISSTSLKQQAYTTLVRPSLEYACSVWDPHTQADKNKIEMIQRRAARFVTNRFRNRSSVGDMLEGLDWHSLERRRRDIRMSTLYQIVNDNVCIRKDSLIPPARLSRNMHPQSFQVPSCRTQTHKYTFFPRTIVDWNSLPPAVATSKTFSSFKLSLSKMYIAN